LEKKQKREKGFFFVFLFLNSFLKIQGIFFFRKKPGIIFKKKPNFFLKKTNLAFFENGYLGKGGFFPIKENPGGGKKPLGKNLFFFLPFFFFFSFNLLGGKGLTQIYFKFGETFFFFSPKKPKSIFRFLGAPNKLGPRGNPNPPFNFKKPPFSWFFIFFFFFFFQLGGGEGENYWFFRG